MIRMEDLRAIMQIIDRNAESISEGDYLELCNRMKTLYKTKGGFKTIFNYEEPMVTGMVQSDETINYFENYYFDTALCIDKTFLDLQLDCLLRERSLHMPIRRITKHVRTNAIAHYCIMHSIVLDDHTPECLKLYHDQNDYILGESNDTFEVALEKLYRSYVLVENQFRSKLRVRIESLVERIDHMIDDLERL